jgi:hypothetical protein
MMFKQLFLALDCESGGIGKDISLLSTHFAVCDANWNIIDELPLLLKPKDVDDTGSTIYKVTASALAINHIDLIEHDKVAITASQAGQDLRNFLWKYSENGKIKLIPMGKNVSGDITWVNENLLGASAWRQFVSYRLYDLTPLIILLKRQGKLPEEAPESLSGLAEFLGINANWHTAKGDTDAGIEVIKRLESL